MTALAADRDTLEKASGFGQRVGEFGGGGLTAATVFYRGALVAFDTATSLLVPGKTSTTLIAVGRCEVVADSAEVSSCNVRSGIFGFENSASADEIANDDVGKVCYIVDDNTVALTNGGATRSKAGMIHAVIDGQVYVAINPDAYSA